MRSNFSISNGEENDRRLAHQWAQVFIEKLIGRYARC